MVVHELRQKYPLRILLQIADLSRSTYYYNIASKDKDEKNKEIIDAIFAIFEKHNGMYGYRRIAAELRNSGQIVNVKKVRRLMRREGLRAKQREKKKYSSYKGTVGTVAENLIQRNFVASHPNEKWFTDG
jgi:transposase InsO family protein